MTLRRRNKVKFEQKGVAEKYHYEAFDNPSVDDVLAFMSHSEAQRRVQFRRAGDSRSSQTPSDELKAYLMDTTD